MKKILLYGRLIAYSIISVIWQQSFAQGINADAIYPIPANVGTLNSGGINIFNGNINDTLTLYRMPARTFSYTLQALYNSRTPALLNANPANYIFTPLGGYGWKLMDYPKIIQDGGSYYMVDGYAAYPLQQIFSTWAGTYQTGVKWGGVSGTWNQSSQLVISSSGTISYDGIVLRNVIVDKNSVSWTRQFNSTAGSITLKRGSNESYFWGAAGIQGNCFMGWFQSGSGGNVDFRGSLTSTVNPGTAYVVGGKYYLWKILLDSTNGMQTWKILTEDGKRFVFDQPAISLGGNRSVWNFSKLQETQWKDSIVFSYTSSGVLSQISNTLGDTLVFQYDTIGTSTNKYLKMISHRRAGEIFDNLIFSYKQTYSVPGTTYFLLSEIQTLQQIASGIYAEKLSGYKFSYIIPSMVLPMGGSKYVGALVQKTIPSGGIITFAYRSTKGGNVGYPLNYSVVQYASNVGYENISGDTLDANIYSAVDYDTTNVTLDATGTYLQYNYAQTFPGGRYFTNDTTKKFPYGNTENYFFNGLPPSRLWDLPPGFDSSTIINKLLNGYSYRTVINNDSTVQNKQTQNALVFNYWNIGYADTIGGLYGGFARLDKNYNQLYGIGEWTSYKYGQYGLPTAVYTSRRNPEPNSPLLNKDSLATVISYAFQQYPALASDSLHILSVPAKMISLVQEDLQGPFIVTGCQCTQWTQWDKRGNPGALVGIWAPWRIVVMRDSSANPDSCFTAGDRGTTKQWIVKNLINKRYPSGAIADSTNVSGTVASTLFSSREYGNYPVGLFINATIDSITGNPPTAGYYGFEKYEGPGSIGWSLGFGSVLRSTYSHTGDYSLSGAIKRIFSPILKTPRTFVFSGWCRVAANSDSCNFYIYNSQSKIIASKTILFGSGTPVWSYVEVTATLQPGQSVIPKVVTSGGALVDDIRFGPIDSPFSAYVYDMNSRIITAVLGTNGETTYLVHNRFNEQIAIVGPGSDGQIQNMTVPYNSRAGKKMMSGGDSFDPIHPNTMLNVTARNGGCWDGFQDTTSSNFPPTNLVNMQIQRQWLTATGTPASASFARTISSKNFLFYTELTPKNILQGQEIGISIQVDSLYDQDSIIVTRQMKFVLSDTAVMLYAGGTKYFSKKIVTSSGSNSLLFAIINNTIFGYLNGRYLFEYTFLLGSFHGPLQLLSTNIGGSFDNFIYVDNPYVYQQTFDAFNRPKQLQGRVNESNLSVSEILYGGPLNLPVAETRSALIGGDNAANSGMSYKPNFATGFNYDSMTISTKSTIANAAGYDNPFSNSIRYDNSPLLRIAMVGGGGDFTAGEKGNHYSTFSYGENAGRVFDYYANELLATIQTHSNGAKHILFTNRENVLFGEAHVAGTDTMKTQYEYDRNLNLVQTYLPNYYDSTIALKDSFIIQRAYDFSNNKIQEKTSDIGLKQFVYDPAGKLRFLIDASGAMQNPDRILYFKYDKLQRVTEEGSVVMQWNRDTLQRRADKEDAWPITSTWTKKYLYDGRGNFPNKLRLVGTMSNTDQDSIPEIYQQFKYDIYGHVTEVSNKAVDFDTLTRVIRYQYDLLGNISCISFPGTNQLDIIFTRNDLGQVTAIGIPGIPSYYALYSYDNEGMDETLNNQGFTRNYSYLSNGWLKALDDQFFNERLTYLHSDSANGNHYDGNISGITDQLFWNSQVLDATFQYDKSNRLKVANLGTTNPWSVGLNSPTKYDKNGNVQLLQLGTSAPYNFQYTTGTNRLKTIQGFSQNYGYTPNGNISSVPFSLKNLAYNALTQHTDSITTGKNQSISFAYNAANQRVIKSTATLGGKKNQLLYLHGLSDYPLIEITKDTLGKQKATYYVYGPTGLVTMRKDTLRFSFIKDHLGSIRAVIDSNNEVKASFNYSPLGSIMNSTMDSAMAMIPLRYLYTGQEMDFESGLYNYRARMYDPSIGRFYSPDPRMQFASPYVYAGNNPIAYFDPTGMWSFWGVVAVVASVVLIAATVVVIAAILAPAAVVAAAAAIGIAASASTIVSTAVGVGAVAYVVAQTSAAIASDPGSHRSTIYPPYKPPGGGTITPPKPPVDATKDKSRRYDQYSYLTAHNAYATSADGWFYAQQSLSMTEQMNRGVRALMLDIHRDSCFTANRCSGSCSECPNGNIVDVYLCHGNCGSACNLTQWLRPLQKLIRLDQSLTEVKTFIEKNKNEVMTIIFESCIGDSSLVKTNFRRSGIDKYVFYPDGTPMKTSKGTTVRWNVLDSIRLGGKPWPTQQWMIDNGLRLVVFSSRRDDGYPRQWDYTVENSYSDQNIWSGSHFQMIPCVKRSESSPLSDTTKMFVFNHFPIFDPGMVIPANTYIIINAYNNITGRINGNCMTAAGRIPNFIATDFIQYGDDGGPRKVVDDLNKSWYIKVYGPVLP